ncbi:recombinase family protein [Breznakia pachnodae]|uniref:Site-specific DNA recombinase n=1 Tax=Breznakia pachnodae TaxID=265178 RepID=A0ABU0E0A3_9FIRM|nr:recombinase family protein [Breznakia pachnodae]MDQ0359975.1 site-specific DNA recombinase [Breznakia pachnodae]
MLVNDGVQKLNADERKIAKYCRESTKRQAQDGYNLEEQERRINNYIELYEMKGETVLYQEFGASAKNLKRPKMRELIKDIKAGKIKCVIVYKLDRLVRRLTSLHEMLVLFKKYDVSFVSMSENFDTNTATGRMVCNVIISIAEWEQDTNSERTNEALSAGARLGNYIKGGKPPFGYVRYSEKEVIMINGRKKDFVKKGLKIHEEESEVIEYIFNLAYDNYSFLEIALMVNELEYMKTIKKTYTEYQIRNILHNKIYCGIMTLKSDEYEINIDAIIDLEFFNKVNKIISRRSKVAINDYLFKNKIYCNCGDLCEQKSTNKINSGECVTYLYYYCPKCKKRINESILIDYTLDKIAKYRKNTEKDIIIKEYQNELNSIEELKENMYNFYVSGKISGDTYISMMMRYEDDYKKKKAEYSTFITEYEIKFNQFSFDKKKKLINNKVKDITVDLDLKIPLKIELKEEKGK